MTCFQQSDVKTNLQMRSGILNQCVMQTIAIFIFSIGCLIELKFCEVSRNSFSNRFWKFQLSVLKNKKVLFLKKIKPLSISKQRSFVYRPNFQWRFWIRRVIFDGIFLKILNWILFPQQKSCQSMFRPSQKPDHFRIHKI